jgi:hypothetical protein
MIVGSTNSGLAGAIGLRDCCFGIGGALAFGINQRFIGFADTVPALVAIHRVIAAADRGDVDVLAIGEIRDELRHVAIGAFRRRVATVEEGVNRDRQAAGGYGLCQGSDVGLMRVDAARRNETDQMRGAVGFLDPRDEFLQRLVLGDRVVGDRLVDARQVLGHDAAGAEIHVADFGIAHLTVGEADVMLAGLQFGMRARLKEFVPVRRVRVEDGVVGLVGALAPAIENAKDDRARNVTVGHRQPYKRKRARRRRAIASRPPSCDAA